MQIKTMGRGCGERMGDWVPEAVRVPDTPSHRPSPTHGHSSL